MDKYYGQWDTDKVAENYFEKTGNAIEVGAAQGTAASNTLYFEERGWNVLCIEPIPALFNQMKRVRKFAFKYALGNKNEDGVDFNVVTLESGEQSALSGLELDKKLLASHPVKNIKTIKVDVRTLDSVLAEFGGFKNVDYVSIDTEGTELDVLKGFDIKKWKPVLFVIENNHNTDGVEKYLSKFGYVKDQRVGVNDFYIRDNTSKQTAKSTTNTKKTPTRSKVDNSSGRQGSEKPKKD